KSMPAEKAELPRPRITAARISRLAAIAHAASCSASAIGNEKEFRLDGLSITIVATGPAISNSMRPVIATARARPIDPACRRGRSHPESRAYAHRDAAAGGGDRSAYATA